MWRVVFPVTVAASCFEIKAVFITGCHDFVKIFIFKKRLCFVKCCWHRMVMNISNVLTRSCNMFVHFCSGKHRHFFQRITPIHFLGNSQHRPWRPDLYSMNLRSAVFSWYIIRSAQDQRWFCLFQR